jgi:solute carrier family 44 protein 1 (choline transporter-like protein)/choline transporter-like protein 2/4/5
MGMGVVYCFGLIYFLSLFAEQIAWICVGLIEIALICLGVAGFFLRQQEVKRQTDFELDPYQLEKSNKSAKQYLALGIVGSLLAVLFCCCITCGFRSLKRAIDVIDAAADFIRGNKRVILVPVLYFVVIVIILTGWISAFACVASMNTINADTSVIPQAKDLIWEDKKVIFMALFMFFGLLWIINWLQYTSNFIVMVGASTYYFSSKPDVEAEAEIGLGFTFAYCYHAGSLAVGALIISIV